MNLHTHTQMSQRNRGRGRQNIKTQAMVTPKLATPAGAILWSYTDSTEC